MAAGESPLDHADSSVVARDGPEGVPLPTLMELMGHSDIKTTMRYVTVTSDQQRAAIALLGRSGQQVGNRPSPATTTPANSPDSFQK